MHRYLKVAVRAGLQRWSTWREGERRHRVEKEALEVREAHEQWLEGRVRLLPLLDQWRESVVDVLPAGSELEIDVDLDEAPSGPWLWFIEFRVGATEWEAIAPPRLDHLAFADEAGYFEVVVGLEEVPGFLRRRVASARGRE
ncbi:hypothetical protein [Streptoalloteichus hindustanus]|uniref:Uncharacterized protein n=1 Tax=Streptoalloteichus hindustanus TaxID=2017 RepID=A0A1M5BBF8_STRHI|nr:hypothetical protein [Streptoalloteichus hindustanus]SHF39768.1 hypothetical protein SAMN05444320_103491 [Streptoalloteichus hindustanus]